MGNLFSKSYGSLKNFMLHRRKEKYGADRSRQDHPEGLPPDQLTSSTNNKKTSKPSAVVVTPTKTVPTAEIVTSTETVLTAATTSDVVAPLIKCSDFYWACRNNKIEVVKKLLETISQDEIDQLEPNGSTALHTASYHGHGEIVKLLLERGADRAIPNKYQYLPFDEALNDEIKELFLRIPSSNRLIMGTGKIEWESVANDALERAKVERQIIQIIYKTVPVNKMFEKIKENYIDIGLTNADKISDVKHFFEKAIKDQDPIWIIKAYTAETDFYKILNAEIAGGASVYQNERKYIIALFSYHPKLDQLSYIGTSYRVMKVSDYELNKYQINTFTMIKSFLSSSIDEKIAACFLCSQEVEREKNPQKVRPNKDGKTIKSWVICKYQIRHRRTALHIENSSQYPAEGEVLVMPYTVFQVKSKKTVKPSYLSDGQLITQIEFEECDQNDDVKIHDT